jgi:hypothetical protein
MDDLGDRLARYWESPAGTTLTVAIAGSGTWFDALAAGVPTTVPILIGETTYHLRSALDDLVYELVILDSGSALAGSRFPIEDSPRGWRTSRRESLKGIHAGHRKAIKRLQPMSGAEWTRMLREVSHPDSHRTLRFVESRVIVPMGGGAGEVISPTANDAMKVDRTHRPLMVFSDRRLPVLETLQALESRVRATLGQFTPCFDGNCSH